MLRIYLTMFFIVLALSGCDGGSGMDVDTSPIGVGLAAIAAGLVLASFIGGAK